MSHSTNPPLDLPDELVDALNTLDRLVPTYLIVLPEFHFERSRSGPEDASLVMLGAIELLRESHERAIEMLRADKAGEQ